MTSENGYRDTQYSRMLLALGAFIALGVGVAVGAVYGPVARIGTWSLGIVELAALLRLTRLTVCVDPFGVHAGLASIPWRYIRRLEVLEGAAMRAAITTGAHPNDYIRLRGTDAGLRLWLDDAVDPHRCWVISVRDVASLRSTLHSLQPSGVDLAA